MTKAEPPKKPKPPKRGDGAGDRVQGLERRMDAIEAKLDALLSKSHEGK